MNIDFFQVEELFSRAEVKKGKKADDTDGTAGAKKQPSVVREGAVGGASKCFVYRCLY